METIIDFLGFNSENSNMFSCSSNAQVIFVEKQLLKKHFLYYYPQGMKRQSRNLL